MSGESVNVRRTRRFIWEIASRIINPKVKAKSGDVRTDLDPLLSTHKRSVHGFHGRIGLIHGGKDI